MDIEERVLDFMVNKCGVSSGERLGVAVSGGPDSVALLHILLSLKDRLGFHPVVLHFNHGIRGERALRDQRFVEALAGNLGVEIHCGKGDVPEYARRNKLSIEEAARHMRYSFFENSRMELNLDRVATGHTKDDLVETFFINLLRGSSLSGLVSLRPVRGVFVRPILCVTRAEVLSYLSQHGADFMEDETNSDQSYLRNRVRCSLIPFLETFNSGIKETISRTVVLLLSDNMYLERVAEDSMFASVEFHGEWFAMDIDKVDGDIAILSRVISMSLKRLLGSVYSISYNNIMRIVGIVASRRGEVHLRGIVKAFVKDARFLIVESYDGKRSH